jgi:general secretion pathway protein G
MQQPRYLTHSQLAARRRLHRLHRLRRLRRLHREGMTLIEIMIVMVIMAMVATAASFAIIPQLEKAKIKQTATDAKAISAAAEMYMAENDGCPTVEELVTHKILKGTTNTKDAWDNDFVISCDQDGAVARSAGPDKQTGSEDDIE